MNDDDFSTGIWGLLYDDPLCELRILGIKTKQTSMAVPNQLSPYQQLDGEIKRIKLEGELGEIFRICGLSTVWDDAKRDVTTSQDYKSALNAASAATDDYRQAIIRAIIAQAILTLRERKKLRYDESPIAPRDRDRITELLLEQMGVHRGVIGWIAKQALGRPATWFIRRNRADYSESAYPMIGDILLYQSRGQAIRDLIREKIKEAKPPVILLAHSLGGIACRRPSDHGIIAGC
ncbi:MAG: hypothetical protein IPJ07_14395 [Acidobacteria bacterium]|nr:hypothetical protein [Acidobacteriota bacterium]